MRKLIPVYLVAMCLALPAAVHAAAPSVPDAEVRDAGGSRVRLDRAVAGKRAVMILIDPAWPEARPWLARLFANAPVPVLEDTVVVLASPQADDRTVDLGLAQWPAVRVFTDKEGLIIKSGKLKTLPSVLGIGADATVRSQLSGGMAVQLDLQAFQRHLRLVLSASR